MSTVLRWTVIFSFIVDRDKELVIKHLETSYFKCKKHLSIFVQWVTVPVNGTRNADQTAPAPVQNTASHSMPQCALSSPMVPWLPRVTCVNWSENRVPWEERSHSTCKENVQVIHVFILVSLYKVNIQETVNDTHWIMFLFGVLSIVLPWLSVE